MSSFQVSHTQNNQNSTYQKQSHNAQQQPLNPSQNIIMNQQIPTVPYNSVTQNQSNGQKENKTMTKLHQMQQKGLKSSRQRENQKQKQYYEKIVSSGMTAIHNQLKQTSMRKSYNLGKSQLFISDEQDYELNGLVTTGGLAKVGLSMISTKNQSTMYNLNNQSMISLANQITSQYNQDQSATYLMLLQEQQKEIQRRKKSLKKHESICNENKTIKNFRDSISAKSSRAKIFELNEPNDQLKENQDQTISTTMRTQRQTTKIDNQQIDHRSQDQLQKMSHKKQNSSLFNQNKHIKITKNQQQQSPYLNQERKEQENAMKMKQRRDSNGVTYYNSQINKIEDKNRHQNAIRKRNSMTNLNENQVNMTQQEHSNLKNSLIQVKQQHQPVHQQQSINSLQIPCYLKKNPSQHLVIIDESNTSDLLISPDIQPRENLRQSNKPLIKSQILLKNQLQKRLSFENEQIVDINKEKEENQGQNNNITEMTYVNPTQTEDLDEATKVQRIYDMRDKNYHIGKEHKIDEVSLNNASENLFKQIRTRKNASINQELRSSSLIVNINQSVSVSKIQTPVEMSQNLQTFNHSKHYSKDNIQNLQTIYENKNDINERLKQLETCLSNQNLNEHQQIVQVNQEANQTLCRPGLFLKNPFITEEDCLSDQVLIKSEELNYQDQNQCNPDNEQFICLNCQIEKSKHEQTKQAMDKAIKLSNILMDEIQKLDSKLEECYKQINSYKQSQLTEQENNIYSRVRQNSNQRLSCNSQNRSSLNELKALTSLIKESRKSMYFADSLNLLKNQNTALRNISQSPTRFFQTNNAQTAKNLNSQSITFQQDQSQIYKSSSKIQESADHSQEDRCMRYSLKKLKKGLQLD